LALDEAPVLARLLVRAGLEAAGQNRQFGREVSGQGLAMARRLGDPETLWTVLSGWRVAASHDPELLDERLAVARELLDLAERTADAERVGLARLWVAGDVFAAGDTAGAAASLDAAEREARAVRSPYLVWSALSHRAGVALLQGRLDEAERLAAEAWDNGRPLDLPEVEACFDDQMRRLALERGRFDEVAERARRWLDRLGAAQGPKVDCARVHLALSAHHLGRGDEARSLLHEMLPNPGARDQDVPGLRLCCVVSAAELCWLLGDAQRAALLAGVLGPFGDVHVVAAGSHCSLGASSRYVAQLATLQDRMDDADAGFEAAHARHEQLGAPGWLARSRADHASMLVRRGRPADLDRARSLVQAAVDAFGALGMGVFASAAAAMVEPGPTDVTGEGTPALDRAGLAHDGDYWSFRYGPAVVRLRDGKGVRYLVALLRAPGRELHALDLVGESGDVPGAVLDPAAKAAYRRRLADLREEFDDATADNDLERASRAQEGIDVLMAELSAAVGGGRGRAANETERARQSVTRAVKATVERLAEANPDLGLHLRSTVRTGVYSTYAPDPRAPIVWEDE
jgi:ATP/maltotriose-dependent transcriptional regulator MalT